MNMDHHYTVVMVACKPLFAGTSATVFTFQGRLDESGLAANGVFDFEIEPYDSIINDNSLASPQILDDITVQDGVFTVELDFGDGPFDGSQVFLEVRDKADADVS